MKLLVLLALTAVVLADLCPRNKKGNLHKGPRKFSDGAKSAVRVAGTALFTISCSELSDSIESVVFGGQCAHLTEQAMCYGYTMKKKYEKQTEPVSYGQLAEDVNGVRDMGNVACGYAAACYDQIAAAVKKCEDGNPDFVQQTLEAAEVLYSATYKSQVQQIADSSSEPLFQELANLVMDNFNSAADVEAALRSFFSEEEQSDIVADAEDARQQFVTVAQEFCNDGCFDKSAAFFKPLFRAMDEDACMVASEFCGYCQDYANDFLDGNNDVVMPCCLKKVAETSITAYNRLEEKYRAIIERFDADLSEQLSDVANDRIDEIVAELEKQSACIKEVYDANKPECA